MSSGCVLKNLFTCEKKCDSLKARKALLAEFIIKGYQVEVIYVDNDGQTTEEEYTILFQLSETQKDSEMIRVHGNAIIQKEEETPIKCHWSGIYLAKNNGYKMKLSGDNIEKDFYLYCDGNETINFLIKKTDPKGTHHGNGVLLGRCYDSISCLKRCNRVYKNKFIEWIDCINSKTCCAGYIDNNTSHFVQSLS
jgi:hypothetical protein